MPARQYASEKRLNRNLKPISKQVVKNAQALAKGLVERGFDLVSGGTDNHLMLVDLRPFDITGKELEHRLDEVYITVNKNAIPNDPQKPFVTSGLRIGTPAVTTRGLGEAEMEKIAEYIYLALRILKTKLTLSVRALLKFVQNIRCTNNIKSFKRRFYNCRCFFKRGEVYEYPTGRFDTS